MNCSICKREFVKGERIVSIAGYAGVQICPGCAENQGLVDLFLELRDKLVVAHEKGNPFRSIEIPKDDIQILPGEARIGLALHNDLVEDIRSARSVKILFK